MAGRVYRRVVLVEHELRNLWLEPAIDVPIRVRRLRRSDVPAYVEFRIKSSEEEVLRRLASGHFCYVTWTGDRISSAVWFQERPVLIPEVDRLLPLERNDVYSYDSFTTPDFRGNNIAAARGAQTTKLLRACGYERAVGFVPPENRASLRVAAKIGVRQIGSMGYFQLGPVRVDFLRLGAEKTLWNARRSPRSLLARLVPRTS